MKIEERLLKIAEEDFDKGRMIGEVNVPRLEEQVDVLTLPNTSVTKNTGKVGDIYWFHEGDQKGTGLLFRGDRISAFNVVLDSLVPNKGIVLQAFTRFWIEQLGITYASGGEYVDPNAIHVKKADVAPVEIIFRKLFGGSGHAGYHKLPLRADGAEDDSKPWSPEHNRFFQGYGIEMGPDMFVSSRAMDQDGKIVPWAELKEPMVTPTEKSDNDPPLTHEQACEIMGRFHYEQAVEYGRRMVMTAQNGILVRAGIIMADTKLEFTQHGLCDEIFTPDSSRFYPIEAYREHQEAVLAGDQTAKLTQAFSKEVVREWLIAEGLKGTSAQLPRELIIATSAGYMQAFENTTRVNIEDFLGDRSVPIQDRINANVDRFLDR